MIIPSIDLRFGKAVQLRQGREKVLERDDPLALAQEFSKFSEIAVVDLDAALGTGNNDALIRKICQVSECRVGGGIRSIDRAAEVISWGVEKVIIGTMAFKDKGVHHDFLKALNSAIGINRVIIALETFYGEIVTEGWQNKTGLRFKTFLEELEPYASELLFTCVEREGLMGGADFDSIKELRTATDLQITVAGGIATLGEIEKLSHLGVNVQLGMALYTGKVSLEDAFLSSLKWGDSLIPTITLDSAYQVLMLAYSSRESLEKTFKTKRSWYYSRSREKLWKKGEISGNFQVFRKIRTDCDGDALLMTVDQIGHACHTGKYSCFGNKSFSLKELYDVIKERIESPSSGSYTSKLTEEILRGKIIEEAHELVEAEKNEDVIWEVADLLYFINVLLAKRGVTLDAVLKELQRRRRLSVESTKEFEGGSSEASKD